MMVAGPLAGKRILVVEDDFLIADELAASLTEAGADAVRVVPRVGAALDLIREETFDAAVLDVNLHGEKVFPVADQLARVGTPFIFATGYDPAVIPAQYSAAACFEKPVNSGNVAAALSMREAQS